MKSSNTDDSENPSEVSIYDRIKSDLKKFIKLGFRIGVNILKIVLSEIATEVFKNKLSITNNLCIRIITRLIKSRLESMSQYKSSSRDDKYLIEKQELEILQSYLSKPLTDEDTNKVNHNECCETCDNRIRVVYSDSDKVDYYCGRDCRYPKDENKVTPDHRCDNYTKII